MKVIILTIVMFGLVTSVWSQCIDLPLNDSNSKIQNTQLKCGEIIDNFQFCTETPKISAKFGEQISIRILLRNVSDKSVTLSNGPLVKDYIFTVTDMDGHKILSRDEELGEYLGSHPEAVKDYDLPLNNNPRTIEIMPNERSGIAFSLNQLYDLKNKGKYIVQINRKLPKRDGIGGNELSFGPIEVEIK